MKSMKGRYMALVEIDYDIKDDVTRNLVPFEVMKDHVTGYTMTDGIRKLLVENVCPPGMGGVTVTKLFANLYEVEEDA